MSIERRKLGSSGITVSPIGLGSMPLATQGRPTEAEAIKVIHATFDLGIDFVDTADVYCIDDNDIGYCEALLKKAIKTWSGNSKIIIATKGGLERPYGSWTVNAHPDHLIKACEASLKALNVESIDLYQLHAPDDSVPFSDSIAALAKLKTAGKIKHIGLSNVSVEEIALARKITDIVSIQNKCSLHHPQAFFDGVLDYCKNEGLAFIPYSPLGGITGKMRTANHPVLLKIAKNRSFNPFQIALAWLLAKSSVIIPIPGASKIESIKSSAAAMQIVLTADEINEIDKNILI